MEKVQSSINEPEISRDTNDIYLHEITTGDKDLAGNVITKIYGQSIGHYIVYESNSKLRISAEENIFILFTTISPLMSLISSITDDLPDLQERAKVLKAKAMLHVCSGELDTGKAILNNFYEYVTRLKNRKAQLQYLFGSFILTIITLLINGFILITLSPSMQNLNISSLLILAISMAVMGGFLSVLLNLKKLEIDNESGFAINVFGGMSRIMIAVIAGIAMLVLIKADILFGFVNEGGSSESIYGLLTLCLLSGFSEGLIPNALKKLEGSSMTSEHLSQK
jgi:hypothetical protein